MPAPLNTLLRTADYAYLFEDSGCRLVVYSSEYAKEVEPALSPVGIKAHTADAFLAELAEASPDLEAQACLAGGRTAKGRRRW